VQKLKLCGLRERCVKSLERKTPKCTAKTRVNPYFCAMKILVIRFSSIGDIVLTTPVVRCLKQQLSAEVHFLTKRAFEKILISNPNIDRVFSIEKRVSEVIELLKNEQYDAVIDLHGNLRTLQVKLQLGVRSSTFDKLNFEKWLMTNLKINRLPNVHIVDRYLKTVEYLGVKNDGKGLDYFIPEQDEVDVISDLGFGISEEHQPDSSFKFVAFVIGAAHATKRLPTEKIIDICNKIALPIVLIGGKEDVERGALIASKSNVYVKNSCGTLNLNQSASVVRQADKVVTHDTGLMHIAAAFGKDIISVWGNTIPEFGMTPYLPTAGSQIMEVHDVSCRPCSKIGHDSCPKGHFKCMEMMDVLAVAEAVNA
jgi:ADP-heptose:LPS heptosyltransferase